MLCCGVLCDVRLPRLTPCVHVCHVCVIHSVLSVRWMYLSYPPGPSYLHPSQPPVCAPMCAWSWPSLCLSREGGREVVMNE